MTTKKSSLEYISNGPPPVGRDAWEKFCGAWNLRNSGKPIPATLTPEIVNNPARFRDWCYGIR